MFGFVVGPKGKTKLEIESDTGAQVIVPRRVSEGRQPGMITLKAGSPAAVTSAAVRIEALIGSALATPK